MFLSSSLYAMGEGEEEKSKGALTIPPPPAALSLSSQKIDWEIKWKTLENYIYEGLQKAKSKKGLPLIEQNQIESLIGKFSNQFNAFFSSNSIPKKTVKSMKSLKEDLLPGFFAFLSFMLDAHRGYLISLSSSSSSSSSSSVDSLAQDVVLSCDIAATEEERRPSLEQFQKVRKIISLTLKEFNFIKEGSSLGLIELKDNPKDCIGYYCDSERGHILFPVTKNKRPQIIFTPLDGFDEEHQRAFVLMPDLEFIRDTGFVIERLPQKIIKIKGYHGKNSLFPFTTYRTTARSSEDEDSPFYPILKEIWQDVKSLENNEAIFIPIPETQQEKDIVELLLIEDLIAEAKAAPQQGEKIKEVEEEEKTLVTEATSQQGGTIKEVEEEEEEEEEEKVLVTKKAPLLLKDDAELELYAAKLEEKVLTEYEQQMRKEQEEISSRVASGADLKPIKTKKGKKTSKSKSVPKEQKVDPKEKKRQILGELKVTGRKKFGDVLKILKSVAQKDPSIIQSVTVKGSHISIHGATGVGTVVRPHGGKDDIAPRIVNKILTRLLGIDE
ncbi:MAG: hypothetical protein A3G78_00145 [Alphaproteobacteria bacterium RIFCSPLOWO2_12_FULL_42_29]|nr:MAG: hypothetical protein A2Z80_04300 [Alphaproteobacteria bacterium GWA2_41_27]OFX03720.1 MAG: hypothetical protein A2W62_02760 [Alphaproteobacteria bacterium RIFCSPLOWO2_02_42_7]OFX08656.1 MAG: hypothetical protein A3G78_00145 [Alphaproteobacteria bacterium RIFCSPLOWO2_12_FULL_42_29]HBW25246.1 hypothetical protein [Holosporales bacterium]